MQFQNLKSHSCQHQKQVLIWTNFFYWLLKNIRIIFKWLKPIAGRDYQTFTLLRKCNLLAFLLHVKNNKTFFLATIKGLQGQMLWPLVKGNNANLIFELKKCSSEKIMTVSSEIKNLLFSNCLLSCLIKLAIFYAEEQSHTL